MYLQFQNFDRRRKPVKGKNAFFNLYIASVYHPCEDKAHKKFNNTLKDFLSEVRDRTEILIGADINAKIGI